MGYRRDYYGFSLNWDEEKQFWGKENMKELSLEKAKKLINEAVEKSLEEEGEEKFLSRWNLREKLEEVGFNIVNYSKYNDWKAMYILQRNDEFDKMLLEKSLFIDKWEGDEVNTETPTYVVEMKHIMEFAYEMLFKDKAYKKILPSEFFETSWGEIFELEVIDFEESINKEKNLNDNRLKGLGWGIFENLIGYHLLHNGEDIIGRWRNEDGLDFIVALAELIQVYRFKDYVLLTEG